MNQRFIQQESKQVKGELSVGALDTDIAIAQRQPSYTLNVT